MKSSRRSKNRQATSLEESAKHFADWADAGLAKKERAKKAERFAAWRDYVTEEMLTRPILRRVAAPVLHSSGESELGNGEAGDAIVTSIYRRAQISPRRPSRLSRCYSTNMFDDDYD